LNANYDRAIVQALENIEGALLEAQAGSSDGIDSVTRLCEENRRPLQAAGVWVFASTAMGHFGRIRNIDTSLANTLVRYIEDTKARTEARSKHPMPQLVEVLGLTCVAFILGQILEVVRHGNGAN
jgi:hypothetical protein